MSEAEAPTDAAIAAADLDARPEEHGSALQLAEQELDALRTELRRAEENELRRIEGRQVHARRNSGRISRAEPHITARSSTEFLELLGEPRRIRSPLAAIPVRGAFPDPPRRRPRDDRAAVPVNSMAASAAFLAASLDKENSRDQTPAKRTQLPARKVAQPQVAHKRVRAVRNGGCVSSTCCLLVLAAACATAAAGGMLWLVLPRSGTSLGAMLLGNATFSRGRPTWPSQHEALPPPAWARRSPPLPSPPPILSSHSPSPSPQLPPPPSAPLPSPPPPPPPPPLPSLPPFGVSSLRPALARLLTYLQTKADEISLALRLPMAIYSVALPLVAVCLLVACCVLARCCGRLFSSRHASDAYARMREDSFVVCSPRLEEVILDSTSSNPIKGREEIGAAAGRRHPAEFLSGAIMKTPARRQQASALSCDSVGAGSSTSCGPVTPRSLVTPDRYRVIWEGARSPNKA